MRGWRMELNSLGGIGGWNGRRSIYLEAVDSVAISASPYFLPSPVWLGYKIRILTVLLHKLYSYLIGQCMSGRKSLGYKDQTMLHKIEPTSSGRIADDCLASLLNSSGLLLRINNMDACQMTLFR